MQKAAQNVSMVAGLCPLSPLSMSSSPAPSRKPSPNKRSRKIEEYILQHVRDGMTFTAAAELAGIDESTFRRWRQCVRPFLEVLDEWGQPLPLDERRWWRCANCTL